MESKNKLLPVIASFKIIKALMLFTVAFGFHHLRNSDVEETITQWVHVIRIDPDSKYAHSAISTVTGIPPAKLHALGIGTFIYGLLFITEGVGLMMGLRWAEYLTVVSTLGFLPLEIYELVEKPGHKDVKAIILVMNILIAIYLIWNLRRPRSKAAPA